MKLSVLICTRNRAKSLEATLARFFEQKFSGEYEYELIVIDNYSADETRAVIEACAARHPGLVRYVHEPRQGLNHARNAGVAASRGEVVVFTDDDVLVSENWLNEIHREFTNDPNLQLMGGRVLLAREGLQQVSLQPLNERRVFAFPDDGGTAMGANMAFRRALFDRVGFFDVRLGPGRFFAGADEVELFYRALKAGYQLLYAPNVLVYHDHDRVRVEQACRLLYSYNKGCTAYLVKHALRGDRFAMRRIYWTLATMVRNLWQAGNRREDAFQHRRAQSRGIAIGIVTAPLVMWLPAPSNI
jgi:glycosyltransferase involved in cell wall biosynthesis